MASVCSLSSFLAEFLVFLASESALISCFILKARPDWFHVRLVTVSLVCVLNSVRFPLRLLQVVPSSQLLPGFCAGILFFFFYPRPPVTSKFTKPISPVFLAQLA